MVTGPINKEALNKTGYHYSGHTEILAELCEVKDVAMMLVSGELRESHVTINVSLREACDLVKKERILKFIQLTHDALKQMGIAEPRMAVAGLNPDAGEGGPFGRQEVEEIEPAVDLGSGKGSLMLWWLCTTMRLISYQVAAPCRGDKGHFGFTHNSHLC